MEIKGILFDKDGTLIDFMASWMPGINEAVEHFSLGDQEIAKKMLKAAGYDETTKTILSGSILAAANNQEIIDCWNQFIDTSAQTDTLSKLEEIFEYHNQHSSQAVTDLTTLFKELNKRGIKIGLATSDSESGAIKTLKALGIYEQMDFVCGYDSGHGVKPHAGMVNGYCKAVNLTPDQVMVVGDNTHDLHMARNAKAQLAVGVLTGTSRAVNLYEADYILDNVSDIPELLDNIR